MCPTWYSAEKLIPQSGRMKLVQRILEPGDSGLTAEARVEEDWPLCVEGNVSSLLCVELIAQSMCALSTWRRGAGAEPRIGLLVGVKDVQFSAATIPVGKRLTIRVDKVSVIGNYALYAGKVSAGPVTFCRAVIQALEPEKELLDALYAAARAPEKGENGDIGNKE